MNVVPCGGGFGRTQEPKGAPSSNPSPPHTLHPNRSGRAACDSPSQDVPCMFTETIAAPAGSYNSLTHQVAFCKMQVRWSVGPLVCCPVSSACCARNPLHTLHTHTQTKKGVRHRLPRDVRGALGVHLRPRQDRRRAFAQPVRLPHGEQHLEGPGALLVGWLVEGGECMYGCMQSVLSVSRSIRSTGWTPEYD